MKKRILVDMSATLIHHGHINILKKASKFGEVIVALTSDKDIKKTKGYTPELNYKERCKILNSIIYVSDVIESPWLIDDNFLDTHNIDFLVHGTDNSNNVRKARLKIFDRTKGISSSELRLRVLKTLSQKIKKNFSIKQ